MAEDLQRTVRQRGVHLQTSYDEELLYEGFVTDLSRGPQNSVSICLRSDESQR
jgi:hypothetical protein